MSRPQPYEPYGYYHGNEADQYTFYRLPKALFVNPRYKNLSDGAKVLYGLMLDRMGLSIKNSWLDEQDRVYIMLETVCTSRQTIRIASDDYPAALVKSKFLKLNPMHIEYVLECIKNNTTEIRNIKKYLLAVLFNATSTMDSYYTSLVAHDMASGKLYGGGKGGGA